MSSALSYHIEVNPKQSEEEPKIDHTLNSFTADHNPSLNRTATRAKTIRQTVIRDALNQRTYLFPHFLKRVLHGLWVRRHRQIVAVLGGHVLITKILRLRKSLHSALLFLAMLACTLCFGREGHNLIPRHYRSNNLSLGHAVKI